MIPIPVMAQILAGFSAPLIDVFKNKLLKKFFDQSNPMEFLFRIEPPGYNNVATTKKNKEITIPIKTEYLLIDF